MAEAIAAGTARRTFHLLGCSALVIAALYWGQQILIPLALAVLLTFVLSPLVSRLEQRGFRRVPATLTVVSLALLLVAIAGWAIALQAVSLIDDLPRHKESVRAKIDQFQGASKSGVLARVQDFLDEIDRASRPEEGDAVRTVRVAPERPSLFAQLQTVIGRFLSVFISILVVLLLVVCMLIHREDLRNRIIRLAGSRRLTLTTRTLDEAGRRIGRYLLGHSLVNGGFGVGVGLGLWVLGVPYPALWGMLAGVLRFVPSVGPWLVAPFPAGLALIQSPDLARPLMVLALFLVLEQINVNLIEPRVCGPSVGVASVPLLLSVLFWTGLWGKVGLVLATPLTVCLAVLGKHVPQLEFLAILLGTRPALRPEARYYQRLLARDRREAAAVVTDYLTTHPADRLYDEVLVPALALARSSRQRNELRPDDEQYILQTTRELLEERPGAAVESLPTNGRSPVLALPACDGADEVALRMLARLAREDGHEVRLVEGDGASGLAALVQQERPAAVFVGALAPGGLTQARYLCRRLRTQFPSLFIVVARWGRRRDPKKARKLLLSAGADRVVITVREARRQLAALSHGSVPALQDVT